MVTRPDLITVEEVISQKKREAILASLLKNRKIRVFHNKRNMNMGYNFKMGIKNASKKYIMLLSGPDSVSLESIKGFLKEIKSSNGGASISSYIANQEIRPGYRQ